MGRDTRDSRSVRAKTLFVFALVLACLGFLNLSASATPPDSSLTFNGSSQYVQFGTVGTGTSDKLNVSTFTLELWFNRTGAGVGTTTSAAGGGGFTTAAVPLLAKGRGEADGSNVDINYFLGIDSTGHLGIDYEEGAAPNLSPGLNHALSGPTVVTQNAWHHAAATYDGTSLRLYLDGKLEASNSALAGRAPRSDSIQRTAIGTALQSTVAGGAAGFFQGRIDEVRIWNLARTWEQIRDTKDDELTSGTGLIGRWGLDEGSGSTAADSTASPINGTLVNSPTWAADSQYAFPQDAIAPSVPTGLAAAMGNKSVTLTWNAVAGTDVAGYNVHRSTSPGVSTAGAPLNGDTLVTGASPNFTDTTAVNSVPYFYVVTAVDTANNKSGASNEVTATPNGAVLLNGTTQYISLGNPAVPNSLGATDFTLETWFKRTGATGTIGGTGSGGLSNAIPLVAKGGAQAETPASLNMNYYLGLDSGTNKLVADFEDTAGGVNHPALAASGVLVASPDVWHHAAVTWDGSAQAWTFYLDGQLDRTVTIAGGPFTPESASAQHAALGATLNDTGARTNAPAGSFGGALDEARIWNVARPQSDIQATMNQEIVSAPGLIGRWGMNEGSGTTTAGSVGSAPASGTLVGTPSWVAGPPLTAAAQAVQLNGSNQHVALGVAPGLASPTFTLETWFRRTGTGIGQQTGTGGLTDAVPLITKGRNESEGSNVDMNYFLGIDETSGRLAVDFEEDGTGTTPGLNHPLLGTTAVTSNVWHHAAATYDGATWKLYLDGRLDASLYVGEPARGDSIQHAALGTAMNSTGVAAGFFAGALDETRIWNVARTGAEIRANKNSASPIPATGLVGQWHFDDPLSTSFADSSGQGNNGTGVNGVQHLGVLGYGFAPDAAAPAAVSNLSAVAGAGTINLNWDASAAADLAGYNVWRSTSSPVNTSGAPLNGELLRWPAYSDWGVTNGTQYFYAVRGVDTANNVGAPSETNVTPIAGDPVFVGAGDNSDCTRTEDAATADLVKQIPGHVFTIGDNAYEDGTPLEFATCYDPTWGAFRDRTRPVPGNHDYNTPGATGYFGYFNDAGMPLRAGDPDLGYYSYDIAGDSYSWHVVVLNSECEPSSGLWLPGGCAEGSPQWQWLKDDLDDAATNNIIALWHKPRFASNSTTQAQTQPLWQLLYEHGADLALGGHWHNYERLAPMDENGAVDNAFGIREFVLGTGGADSAAFGGFVYPTSQKRVDNAFGVMKFTLHESSFDWQFVQASGNPVNDSGTQTVHGIPDLTTPVVSGVSASPDSLVFSDTSTDVTWHASEDGAYSVRVGGADCSSGAVVASGTYSTAPDDVVTTVQASDLVDGSNTIRVCVFDGFNTGSSSTVVSKNSTLPDAALRFDGNDAVDFGAATSTLGSEVFTIETWFRRTGEGTPTNTGSGGIGDAVPLVTKGRSETDAPANVNMNWFLGIDSSDDVLVADFEDAATGLNHPIAGTTAIASDGAWHHAAASYDGITWRLYLDGKLETKSTESATPESGSIQHAALGTAINSTGVTDGAFVGDLDEVRIWRVARTGAEIRSNKDDELPGLDPDLMARWSFKQAPGSPIVDSSGNGVSGALTGGTFVANYAFTQDTTSPGDASALVATPGGASANLTWTASAASDVAGYDVFRATSTPVPTGGTPVNGIDLVTGTSYTDTGLTVGTEYFYAVVAVDRADNRSGAVESLGVTPIAADPVLVGAGDIATCTRTQDTETGALIGTIPGHVFTLGDNVYVNGTTDEFNNCYDPAWGAVRDRTRPTPGNHDYNTPNGTGYFGYFNDASMPDRAGDPDLGYYSYDIDGVGFKWHIVVLNSECETSGGLWLPGGCAVGSVQYNWLKTDLENAGTNNVIAMWHKPLFSSNGDLTHMRPLWQVLYDHGADLVLSGHRHIYERFAPMDADGVVDNTYGIREFEVGTGGADVQALGAQRANSQVAVDDVYGVMKLTLHASSVDWEFVRTSGNALTDSGNQPVHGAPPDTTDPTVAITNVNPAQVGPGDASVDVTWSADENGAYDVRLGGTSCGTGASVAAGTYTGPNDVVTTISSATLAEGDNTVRVCVTDASTNTGSDSTVIVKDSTPPVNGLHFDGNDNVAFGPATSELGVSTFTIETWFRRTGAGTAIDTGGNGIAAAIPLVTKGRGESDTPANLNMNYFLGIDATSGVLVADFEDENGGQNHPASGATVVSSNVWHHAAATYDGEFLRLYLDGKLERKEDVGAEGPESDSIQHAALGTAMDSTGAAAGFFIGDLDEVRIWDVARSGSELRVNKDEELAGSQPGMKGRWALNQLAGSTAVDGSGHGVTGTVNGATWVAGYTFPQDTTPPAQPTGLAGVPDDGQISLTWSAGAAEVAGYDLYRGLVSPVPTNGTPVNGDDLITTNQYVDSGLTNGVLYRYRLVAVDRADNRSSPSTEASATPVLGDPVLLGAGDIADCDRTQDNDTGALIAARNGGVFTLGDNVYDNGTATEFANCYDPAWGSFRTRTRPVPGNHDYGNGSNNGGGYFGYFNDATTPNRAGDAATGYFSYDVGSFWHVVVVNTECYAYNVCTGGTGAQLSWLQSDLASNLGKNVIAMMHKPRWSSGTNSPGMPEFQPLWQTLYDYGVELLLVGHDHHYERFAPQNGAGALDNTFGVREIIVGTGGETIGSPGAAVANSQVRQGTSYGILRLRLHQTSYDWDFIPTVAGGFTDSGTQSIHGIPNTRPVIDSVTINQASPATNSVLSATVTSHDLNGDAVTLAYQWSRNGVDIAGATNATLNLATAGNGDRGDAIRLRVTGSDGGGAGTPLTAAPVTVINTAPTATVNITPDPPGTNATVTATATRADADGDTITLDYVWKVNGTIKKTTFASASLTNTFDLSVAGNGDGGDAITVEVTPKDGTASGTLATDSVTVDPPPAAPTGLGAVVSTTSVALDWANNTEPDLAGYNIYRSDAGGPYNKLNSTVVAASNYADPTGPAQTALSYQVKAVDSLGGESAAATTSASRSVAFRASSATKATGSSIAVSRPVGTQTNDVLVAAIMLRSSSTIATPAGWTLVRSDTNGTALRTSIFVHVAAAADPSQFTWTLSGSQSALGVISAYAGVNTLGPVDVSSGQANSSSTTIATLSAVTTASNAAVVGVFASAINATIAPPASMTEQAEVLGTGKAKSALESADRLQPTDGSTGVLSATSANAAVSIGQLVALRPADVPAPPPPPDGVAPTQPGSLTATAVGPTTINLSWTAATDNVGVVRYEVKRGATVLDSNVTGTTFSDTTAPPNASSSYTVQAFDAAGNGSPLANASATTADITFRGVTSASTKSASSLSLSKPAAAGTGDLLLVSIDVRGATTVTSPATVPGGWTALGSNAAGTAMTKATFYRFVGAGEAGPYLFSFSSSQAAVGTVSAYNGVTSVSQVGLVTSASATTSLSTSATIPSSGSVLVSLVGFASNGAIGPPAAQTERVELAAGSGANRIAGEFSDSTRAAGPTGTLTATTSKAAAGVHQLIALSA